jgi:large subunit ribosomal protein L24
VKRSGTGTSKQSMKIRKGDRVVVLTGKDRGKEGEVSRALPTKGKVIVDGVNVAKRHQKATRTTMQGGIIDKDMPIPVSNVAILCSSCGATRIGYRFDPDGQKIRICRKCGGDL